MANPIRLLSRKILQHPWLKTPGNLAIMVVGLLFAITLILNVIAGNRVSTAISACKSQGGTPIYRKHIQKIPTDSQGGTVNQEYSAFDYCDLRK
jgi:hypothetical protein